MNSTTSKPRFRDVLRAMTERELAGKVAFRLSLVITLISMIFFLAALFYVSKLVNPQLLGGSDYFTFTVIGLGFYSLVSQLMYVPRTVVAIEIGYGTFETLLGMRVPIHYLINAGMLRDGFRSFLKASAIIAIGGFVGASLQWGSLLSFFPALFFGIVAAAGMGYIQVGLEMRARRLGRVTNIFGGAGALLTGVYFPVDYLPSFLQNLAYLLPPTHVINAARSCLLEGVMPWESCLRLAGLSLIYAIIGLLAYRSGLKSLLLQATYLTY